MPKVHLTQSERYGTKIRGNISKYMGENYESVGTMARVIHKSVSTWRARMNAPKNFTIAELLRIAAHFHISINDLLKGE